MLVVSCSMNVLTVIVRAKIRKVLHCKRSKCKKILTVVGKFSRSFFDRRSEKCCIALQFYLVKLMCWTKVDNFILRRILRWFLIWPQILRSISASLSITGSPNHGIWTFFEEFQPSFYAFFQFFVYKYIRHTSPLLLKISLFPIWKNGHFNLWLLDLTEPFGVWKDSHSWSIILWPDIFPDPADEK